MDKIDWPSGQTTLAILAMIGMVGIGGALIFEAVPASNHDYFLIILGALAGALTASGVNKPASTKTGDINLAPKEGA